MIRFRRFALLPALLLAASAVIATSQVPPPPEAPAADAFGDPALVAAVRAAETAFAQTMADRDFDAFAAHIADDAIFVNGARPLNGKATILAEWRNYFADAEAPFSWRPETVVVLSSGQLAQTKGPVFAPDGNVVAEFRSTWRRDADGTWRVVFDDGACACRRAAPAEAAPAAAE
ncbi:YybH family protein [Arenimonas composti]|uniref:DUF4440 domain-containing protein n=1 Tax=Arenimonas composti TR7-09 = DSM 18010 TaxID=1121013 RepID=A0A091BAG7_9GAMM|nr:nuclear transport factor 2 family protein [Arenimonas composti]KFN49668.1 hypothetical protein P873_09885 [Arenimonas composti TR7-09 = DSM 18010]